MNYEIVKHISVLSDAGNGYTKELNLIAWNGTRPKYDLRTWYATENGKTMCKGITLSDDEMNALIEAVNERSRA